MIGIMPGRTIIFRLRVEGISWNGAVLSLLQLANSANLPKRSFLPAIDRFPASISAPLSLSPREPSPVSVDTPP